MPPTKASRRKKSSTAAAFGRVDWLRIIAILIGVGVLLGHVYAPRHPAGHTPWFPPSWTDLMKHSATLFIFAAAYRFSWRGLAGRATAGLARLGAGQATALFCGGWGAICEITQIWISGRQFSPIELGINVLVPVLTAGLLSVFTWDNFRP